ncbi:MAG: 4-hydroxybenzoate octaprenyltransferase [Pseudomonadales bacterium]|jgi:4-hydroxybenzoate polyprenyltransferase|nr:4-hydroxybenzoate octaprenyltransferase [Pseudomonadales bacterium]MCP5213559.1 4-hydroxybenzoate octaprenyltransferase [Pseudomonadales bacterium]
MTLSSSLKNQLGDYARLMRLDKPIGTYLLLWPTLWALWIAADGFPSERVLIIFVLGVICMRAAGCIINDFADRKIDHQVERTRERPLTTGKVSVAEASILFAVLVATSLYLVLLTNTLTIGLSFIAILLTATYPFMKRYTYLPQVVLGAAFSMSIPMAFAAETNAVPLIAWLVYTANVLWTVVYDTIYAMVDRDDDLRIGVKSTAILFGEADKLIIGILQLLTLTALAATGYQLNMGHWFYASLVLVSLIFLYHQYLMKDRERSLCFRAFLHNHWVGMIIFIGILLNYGYQ